MLMSRLVYTLVYATLCYSWFTLHMLMLMVMLISQCKRDLKGQEFDEYEDNKIAKLV